MHQSLSIPIRAKQVAPIEATYGPSWTSSSLRPALTPSQKDRPALQQDAHEATISVWNKLQIQDLQKKREGAYEPRTHGKNSKPEQSPPKELGSRSRSPRIYRRRDTIFPYRPGRRRSCSPFAEVHELGRLDRLAPHVSQACGVGGWKTTLPCRGLLPLGGSGSHCTWALLMRIWGRSFLETLSPRMGRILKC